MKKKLLPIAFLIVVLITAMMVSCEVDSVNYETASSVNFAPADDDVLNWDQIQLGLIVTQEEDTIYLSGTLFNERVWALTADEETNLKGFGKVKNYYQDGLESEWVTLVPFKVGENDIHVLILGDATVSTTYNPSDYVENVGALDIDYTIDFTGLVWPEADDE